MSRMAVSDRFRYRTPWTLDEVGALCQLLQVPPSVLLGEAPGTVDQGQQPTSGLGLPDRGGRLPPSMGQLLQGDSFLMVG